MVKNVPQEVVDREDRRGRLLRFWSSAEYPIGQPGISDMRSLTRVAQHMAEEDRNSSKSIGAVHCRSTDRDKDR